jgi:hypothetical protein
MPRTCSSSGNPANARDPGALDAVHDGFQVPCPLSGAGLEFGHGFRVAYQFPLSARGAVGVSKALDVRPRCPVRNPLVSGGQGPASN